jgi:hypothetical protein
MAKSPRASSEDLFSISGASDALGRSRRTVAKALAGVKPAVKRSGLKLWRMKTIISAINNNTEAPLITRVTGEGKVLTGIAAECAIKFEEWDAAYEVMKALPTLAARRAAAHKMRPLFEECLETMRERDTSFNLDPEHVELRNNQVRLLMMRCFEEACKWTSLECLIAMEGGEEDEDAA